LPYQGELQASLLTMKSIITKWLMLAIMQLSPTLAHAFDFTENSPEGIPLNFTILATEEGASPQAEISGLAETPTESIQKLTLPGEITHDGTTYKVTSVGEKAFYFHGKILSIEVGE